MARSKHKLKTVKLDIPVTLEAIASLEIGTVAYLNGVEIASSNAPANPTWDSTATTNQNDAAAVSLDTSAIETLDDPR